MESMRGQDQDQARHGLPGGCPFSTPALKLILLFIGLTVCCIFTWAMIIIDCGRCRITGVAAIGIRDLAEQWMSICKQLEESRSPLNVMELSIVLVS
jgi:hypothetical protein